MNNVGSSDNAILIILLCTISRGRYSRFSFESISHSMTNLLIAQTVSLLLSFFLAMTLFPDAQSGAKQEIDTVIGSEHLITLDDRASLPYFEALLREVMRWRPVTPLSIFHACSADDIYKGFHIPKGQQNLGWR